VQSYGILLIIMLAAVQFYQRSMGGGKKSGIAFPNCQKSVMMCCCDSYQSIVVTSHALHVGGWCETMFRCMIAMQKDCPQIIHAMTTLKGPTGRFAFGFHRYGAMTVHTGKNILGPIHGPKGRGGSIGESIFEAGRYTKGGLHTGKGFRWIGMAQVQPSLVVIPIQVGVIVRSDQYAPFIFLDNTIGIMLIVEALNPRLHVQHAQ